jgi:plastocyanin
MSRIITKPYPAAVLCLIVASVVLLLGYLQHSALGQSGKTGTIAGVVSDTLLATDTAVVYIKEFHGELPVQKAVSTVAVKKITFQPRVLPVLVGTTIQCPNEDSLTHNIFSPNKGAKPFNFGIYPPGSKKEITATKVGVIPFLCNIHAEMAAFCVVCPNPFFTKTDADGRFKLSNVPEGTYKLTFWHEKLRPKTIEVKVIAGETAEVEFRELERGKYSVDLTR